MRVAGRETGSSHEDMLLSGLYQQVTELQEPLFGAEYDLAKGAIRLIHEEGCKNVNLAYWVAGTSQPFSMMDIQWTTPRSPHTTGTATINGVNIRVMFDTGAATSMLSGRAAERARDAVAALRELGCETTLVPTVHPVVDIVRFQLMTLAIAEARGIDPDRIHRDDERCERARAAYS